MMPKTPKNKKKRAKVDLERRKKKAKRLKFDDEVEGQQIQHEGSGSEHNEEDDDSDSTEGGENMLEKMLEEHAVKNNLSAINVKSILHHVITDRRVLELVQKVIAEKEREQSGDDIDLDYEPKMTRSKYRQKTLEDPISQLTKSPLKKPVSTFTDLEFPESSSDEEYEPNEDEEDEDTESYVSAQSDLASPFKPATPETVEADSIQDACVTETTSVSVSRPLTRHRSQDRIFKKPSDTATVADTIPSDENDLIAKRTRSLLPLKDKEVPLYDIELPDFSPDLYDQVKVDELDEDQIAFQKFLQSIANGDVEDLGEDDDCEYDFMAESTENHDTVEEKEEYRNDRAVRIPKKEVSDLFAELLSECNANDDENALWSTRSLLLDLEEEDQDTVIFTTEQRTQLTKQMNQHVQLLAQVYLLSREEPSLQEEAETCRQFVNELQGFCDRSLSVHPIMALGGDMPVVSMFDVPGIQEAVRIVNEPFSQVKRPRSPRKQPSTPIKDSKSKGTRVTIHVPPISLTNQSIMANSILFKDLVLLPRCGFMDKDLLGKKESSSLRVKFTDTEDNLLAIGMNQFQRHWKLIQAHLLPVKTPKQLQIRCKNLLSSRASNNIVKHLRDTKTLWKLPADIKISYNDAENGNRRFSNQEKPDWLINYRQKMKPQKRLLPPTPKKSPANKPTMSNSPTTPTNKLLTSTSPINKISTSNTATRKYLISNTFTKPLSIGNMSQSTKQVSLNNTQSSCNKYSTNNPLRDTLQQNITMKDETQDETQRGSLNLEEDLTVNTPGPTQESIGLKFEQSEGRSTGEQSQAGNTGKKLQDNKKRSNEANHDNEAENQPSPDCNIGDDNTDHMTVDSAPVTPVSQQDDSNQGTSPVQSESVPEPKALKTSPASTGSKCKVLRDKVTSVTPLSSSNNKKTLQNLQPLPPDPKEQIRAQALADSYLSKVKNCLQDNQEHYEEFLSALVESSTHQWTPVQLFKRMETVLADYPELIEDFVAFLEPEQALEAGVLMENLEFIRARTFLRRLEVHFHKHRAHFHKIIEVFRKWGEGDQGPLELHEKVIPLLRGQQHLVDEFQTFFDHLKPPACCEEDFEEIEIASGSDQEVDDFEEVVIPKHQGKIKAKQPPNPSTKNTASKQKPTSKQAQLSPLYKTTKYDRRRQASKKSPPLLDGLSIGVSPSSRRRQRKVHDDELEQGPSSVTTDWSTSDGPPSVTSTFLNDTSNDSVKHDEYDNTPQDRWMTTDAVDDADDLDGNDDDVNDDDGEDDDIGDDDDDVGGGDVGDDDVGDDSVGDDDDGVVGDDDDVGDDDVGGDGDDESDNYEDNESAYDDTCDDTEDGSEFLQGTLSAQNHQLDQDGKLVVLWTRDDDRTILSVCHNQGATTEIFHELAAKLDGKTPQEIENRFKELMKLYEAGNSKEQLSSDEDDDNSDGSENADDDS